MDFLFSFAPFVRSSCGEVRLLGVLRPSTPIRFMSERKSVGHAAVMRLRQQRWKSSDSWSHLNTCRGKICFIAVLTRIKVIRQRYLQQ